MNQDKKVIIFDFDGVILDSVSLANELSRRSFPGISEEQIKNLHTENLYEGLQKLSSLRKEETEEEKAAHRLEYTQKKLALPLFEGMKEVVATLAINNVIVLNTSAAERNTLPILERHDLHEHFSFIGSVEVHKSKIEKFKIIAEKFGKPFSELRFITDTIGDVREAEELGIPTIVVTWGVHTREDFIGLTHSNLLAFVDTPAELLQLLD